ncbi:hypothetical protein DP49_5928 [Burkholderia pseudomallei]|uniref:hypothetical protein n=1 Tax=Burkholderia pseudomallei TaxID=28450 RepID=UPI00050E8423|nr:hypothetical protein [Burkholderia pseudomallei]KGD58383.1 hypothetical protein DP49_5928 [Burkholderia pseudomallei]
MYRQSGARTGAALSRRAAIMRLRSLSIVPAFFMIRAALRAMRLLRSRSIGRLRAFGLPTRPRSPEATRARRPGMPPGVRARRAAVVLGALASLAACSPAYDWRTLHNDAGYTIDLPAKPTVEEHPVAIGGVPMKMRMQAAHVGGAVFAVGTVMLPDERDATQHAVLDYLRTGLARNLRARPDERAVLVPLAAGGQAAGVELRMSGAPAGAAGAPGADRQADRASGAHAPKTVIARLVARGRRVYEVIVIADAPLASEPLEQFFGSLKLD